MKNKAAESALREINDDVKDITSKMNGLKGTIVEAAQSAVETGTENLAAVRERADKEWVRLRKNGTKQLRKVENRVREKPAQSLVVAFIAGLAASVLFAARNREE